MKRLKIGWLQTWVVAALVSCISAGLCIMVFYAGKDAQAGQALPGGGGVASASVISASRAGVKGTAPVTPLAKENPALRFRWTHLRCIKMVVG